jgi:hypothetical protein
LDFIICLVQNARHAGVYEADSRKNRRELKLSENDPVQFLAQDFSFVIVHEAEAVAVVGGA